MMRKSNGAGWQEFHEHVYVGRTGFPFLGFTLLTIGVLWLLQSTGVIKVEIPWWPVLLILIGLGIVVRRFFK